MFKIKDIKESQSLTSLRPTDIVGNKQLGMLIQ